MTLRAFVLPAGLRLTKFFTTFYIHNDNILRMVFLLFAPWRSACWASAFPRFRSPNRDIRELEVLATHTEGACWHDHLWPVFEHGSPHGFFVLVPGDDNNPMVMSSSTGTWYNNALSPSWNASGANPLFFDAFPELAYDSFLTIGASSAIEMPHPQAVFGPVDVTAEFTGDGPGENVVVDDGLGGAWFVTFPGLDAIDTHPAFAGADLKILVAQYTTEGEMSGQLQVQVFKRESKTTNTRTPPAVRRRGGLRSRVHGSHGREPRRRSCHNDGTCEYVTASEGCTDDLACNYYF